MEVVLLRKWYILCFLLCLCGHVDAQNKEYWLDEVYQASYCVQDWGMPQKNQAVVWTPSPLTVNGVTYKRGVGGILSKLQPYGWTYVNIDDG